MTLLWIALLPAAVTAAWIRYCQVVTDNAYFVQAQGMAGESGQAEGDTDRVAGAGAEASTPEADGTRGSGGESTPPVVYFRYFAPLDAG